MIKVHEDHLPSVCELKRNLNSLQLHYKLVANNGLTVRLDYVSAYLLLEIAVKKLSLKVYGFYNNSSHNINGYLNTLFKMTDDLKYLKRHLIKLGVLSKIQSMDFVNLRYNGAYNTDTLPDLPTMYYLIKLTISLLGD